MYDYLAKNICSFKSKCIKRVRDTLQCQITMEIIGTRIHSAKIPHERLKSINNDVIFDI